MVRGPFGVCRVTLKPLVTTAARLMSGLCGALAPEVNGALAVACMAVLPMGRKGAELGIGDRQVGCAPPCHAPRAYLRAWSS